MSQCDTPVLYNSNNLQKHCCYSKPKLTAATPQYRSSSSANLDLGVS